MLRKLKIRLGGGVDVAGNNVAVAEEPPKATSQGPSDGSGNVVQ